MLRLDRTPSQRKPLLVFAVSLIASQPVFIFLHYFWNELRGVYPSDADSIAIPIFYGWIAWVIWAPLVLAVVFWALRAYRGSSWLFKWNGNRPIWSVAWSLVFGVLIAESALCIPFDVRWLNMSSLLNDVLWIWFFLALRTLLVAKEGRPSRTDPSTSSG
jgi:hypothetical protein